MGELLTTIILVLSIATAYVLGVPVIWIAWNKVLDLIFGKVEESHGDL